MSEKTLLSVSKIAMRLELDRATVNKRLAAAGVSPVKESSNEKLYELTDELEEILLKSDDELEALKKRKLQAETELKETSLDRKSVV